MSAQADITLRDVWKSFGEKRVLEGFSAHIPGGGRVALMGPSGSGKTTLSRIIMGLDAPDAGVVECVKDLRFCPVFQEDRLCEGLDAIANVGLVLPKAGQGGIAAALDALGLGRQELSGPVQRLSGGERRRIALARAVLAPGDVLVLDEAFKGLDMATRQKAFEFIDANLGGRTLLLITHDTTEAEALATQVVNVGAMEIGR